MLQFTRDWKAFCISRGSSYVLDAWKFSLVGRDFLDVFVHKSDDELRFEYFPHVKASSLGICLNYKSAHPRSLHRSWPMGVCQRLALNSSCRVAYEKAKSRFIERLVNSFVDQETVELVRKDDAFAASRRTRAGIQPRREDRLLVVFPSHPAWHKSGVHAVLREWSTSLTSQTLWGMAESSVRAGTDHERNFLPPTLRIAWKNIEATHLINRLRL